MPLAADHRYTVISSDCHGGANIADYRPYLESAYHDEFDAWFADYENPYDDVKGADADRNWDSDRRLREMQADGIVAEVVFPNTIPPFFPKVPWSTSLPGPARATWTSGWRASGPTTGGWPTPAPTRRANGPGSHRSCCTTSTPRWPRSGGLPSTA